MSEEKKNDVGGILKTEREARGISLDVVQEATKIPIDSLRAIEGGYKVRTLTSFYYRSFVKLYAQYLGLDPVPVLSLIPDYRPSSKIAVQEKKVAPASALRLARGLPVPSGILTLAQQAAVPLLAGMIVLGVISGTVFLIKRTLASFEARPAIARTSTSGKDLHPLAQKRFVEKKKSSQPAEAKPVLKPAVKPQEAKKGEASQPVVKDEAAPQVKKSEETAAVKPARKVVVTVRAGTTAWLKVKIDAAVVFEGSLKKGTSETWTGIKRIEISGKGIDQLEFEYNGKPQGRLARRDIKIGRVIVTPESFSVEK